MGRVCTLVSRGIFAAFFGFALLGTGVVPLAGPGAAGAQTVEDQSLDSLAREFQRAHNAYLQMLGYANAAANERRARQAAGAAADELRELDAKAALLVAKAENLKIRADYLEELLKTEKQEYKNK